MRIYRMTATFGKLEHQTLTLKPGLNIITAPNEWGKSTWCAFLIAMLYGMDTRTKSTKQSLSPKEHYQPWSGEPMSGRIDLNWEGRNITLERRTKGRIPLGEFRAYETETGIEIPELTADNCGRMLLGVEQSVFRRTGFIRQADLPVTQDEALRRRLNALVTTGDESGDADRLADSLRDLRNKIRYNRTGLLPQAEAERNTLEDTLSELTALQSQSAVCSDRIRELETLISRLNNHRQALDYAASLDNEGRTEQARSAMDGARTRLHQLETACEGLPPPEETRSAVRELQDLLREKSDLQDTIGTLPPKPQEPPAPHPFENMSIEEARKMVYRDAKAYVTAKRTSMAILLITVGTLGLVAAGMLIYLKAYLFALSAGAGSLAALIWGIYERTSMGKAAAHLQKKYGSKDHSRWSQPLTLYEKQYNQYLEAASRYRETSNTIQIRLTALTDRFEALCGSERPEIVLENLIRILQTQESCESARREAEISQVHFDALRATMRNVQPPAFPDDMTETSAQTEELLARYTQELQHQQNRLGQYQGRMEALGSADSLRQKLEQKRLQILKLENTYTALSIAWDTLIQAKEELQRRFAPRITKRAQELMSAMTDGRYAALTIDTGFSLRAGTDREDTLREVLWRSDGTVDQLYLSLRLAVAEALTPQAPLVLDDALIRFDDRRMEAAVEILREMSRSRQIILFTCQDRESRLE